MFVFKVYKSTQFNNTLDILSSTWRNRLRIKKDLNIMLSDIQDTSQVRSKKFLKYISHLNGYPDIMSSIDEFEKEMTENAIMRALDSISLGQNVVIGNLKYNYLNWKSFPDILKQLWYKDVAQDFPISMYLAEYLLNNYNQMENIILHSESKRSDTLDFFFKDYPYNKVSKKQAKNLLNFIKTDFELSNYDGEDINYLKSILEKTSTGFYYLIIFEVG